MADYVTQQVLNELHENLSQKPLFTPADWALGTSLEKQICLAGPFPVIATPAAIKLTWERLLPIRRIHPQLGHLLKTLSTRFSRTNSHL